MPTRRGDPPPGLNKNVYVEGRRTSLRLEPAFWEALDEASQNSGLKQGELVGRIEASRRSANLSAAVRVWLLRYYKEASAPQRPAQMRTAAETALSTDGRERLIRAWDEIPVDAVRHELIMLAESLARDLAHRSDANRAGMNEPDAA